MKKVFSLLITLAMLVSTMVVPMTVSADTTAWDGVTTDSSWTATGDGTAADPYEISSAAQLADLASKVYNAISTSTDVPVEVATDLPAYNESIYNAYTGKYFVLTADIDLGGNEWLPIGRMGMRFNGNFDGAGHVVKNLSMTTMYYGMGLFGGTGANVSISDIGIENADFTFKVNNGKPADYLASDATLDKTYFNMTYRKDDGSTDTINRLWGVGALVGIFGGGSFSGCYAKDVTITNTGDQGRNAGGLLGGPCTAISDTSGATPMTVENCYINGATLTGNIGRSGAMYGSSKFGSSGFDRGVAETVTNCYVANASGDFRWGLGDGDCSAGKWVNCYTTKQFFTDTSTTGNANRTAKDAALVHTKAEIVEYFDTVSAWCADNDEEPINDGYPVLVWQNTWESIWDGTTDTTWEGKGTAAEPYLITSAAELAGLAKKINDITSATGLTKSAYTSDQRGSTVQYLVCTGEYYKLTTDIDLADNDWLPIGSYGMRFNGNFDGDNHVVKNLTMTTERSAAGLFGGIGTNARITNLGVEDVDIRTNIGNLTETYEWDTNRCVAFAGLVAVMEPGGSTEKPVIENCYAKDVYIKPIDAERGIGKSGGLVGTVAVYTNASSTNNYHRYYISDCYVNNVEIYSHTEVGGFIGGANNKSHGNPVITNCYVAGDIDLYLTSGNTLYSVSTDTDGNATYTSLEVTIGNGWPEGYDDAVLLRSGTYYTKAEWYAEKVFNFGDCRANNFETIATVENCYTTTNEYYASTTVDNDLVTYATSADVISAGLVTGNDAWNLDSVTAPTNGGYPVLGWEGVTDELSSFKGTGVTVAEGYVTDAKLIKSYSNVSGLVYVAVYDGTRFVSAATAAAENGVADIDDMAVSSGNTIKVFVWDSASGLNPLSLVYSTTVE